MEEVACIRKARPATPGSTALCGNASCLPARSSTSWSSRSTKASRGRAGADAALDRRLRHPSGPSPRSLPNSALSAAGWTRAPSSTPMVGAATTAWLTSATATSGNEFTKGAVHINGIEGFWGLVRLTKGPVQTHRPSTSKKPNGTTDMLTCPATIPKLSQPGMIQTKIPASRTGAIPRVFKFMSSMDPKEVARILKTKEFSGSTSLGPIAEAIEDRSRERLHDSQGGMENLPDRHTLSESETAAFSNNVSARK